MSFHPFLFLSGYRVYRADKADAPRLLELCRIRGISYYKMTVEGESVSFCTPFFSSFALEKEARGQNITLTLISSHGLGSLLFRYRRRYGIFAGLMLSALLIAASGSVIWDVRIDGEDRLCEREVIDLLYDCGLGVGTPRRSIDVATLENRVLIRSDDIAWISVNIIGTVAEVEIRELVLPEASEELPTASNFVAIREGRIVEFENVKGNIAVEVGESVSEGQLLVGGIYGDEESGFRYSNPEGRVLARTLRDFELKIDRKQSKKVYTGEVKCEKYLIFFRKRIKFFANYRNLPPSCDKIIVEEFLPAPNGATLPFGIMSVRYLEYENTEQTLDEKALAAIADERVDALIASELADAEILKKSVSISFDESGARAHCKIGCIENIARRKEIEIE